MCVCVCVCVCVVVVVVVVVVDVVFVCLCLLLGFLLLFFPIHDLFSFGEHVLIVLHKIPIKGHGWEDRSVQLTTAMCAGSGQEIVGQAGLAAAPVPPLHADAVVVTNVIGQGLQE